VIREAPVDTFGHPCHRGIQAQGSPEAFLRWIRKEGEICISGMTRARSLDSYTFLTPLVSRHTRPGLNAMIRQSHHSSASEKCRPRNPERACVLMEEEHVRAGSEIFHRVAGRSQVLSTPLDYSMATVRIRTSRQIGFAEPVSLFR
jgi:hypothetical protein